MTNSINWRDIQVWIRRTVNVFPRINNKLTCNDDSFGPVSTCRFFDFTLTFQNFILLIASGLFILSSLIQIIILTRGSIIGKKKKSVFQQNQIDYVGLIRLILAIVQTIIAAILLGLSVNDQSIRQAIISRTGLPAYTLTFLASLLHIPLTIIVRQRLVSGGSEFLSIYAFCTLFTDASRIRTYSNVELLQSSSFFRLCVVNLVIKGLILVVENTSALPDPNASPESRAGFISRLTFWWLTKLIWTGFRRPLDMVNLDSLGLEFDSETVGKQLQREWEKQVLRSLHRANPNEKVNINAGRNSSAIELDDLSSPPAETSSPLNFIDQAEIEKITSESRILLMKSCFFAFPLAVMAPAIPALLHVGVQLCMPYLVSRTVAFAESQMDKNGAEPSAYGWGLVGAFGFATLIDAFATAQFQWLASKVSIILRGGLIDMIYRKSLSIHLSIANELGSGSIANLMSVDVERLSTIVLSFHYLWSGILQAAISLYLLYHQIGLSFLAALFSIIICLLMPPLLGRHLGTHQANWSASTDDRVNLVSTAVNNAKSVKYMAYDKFIANKLLEARKEELRIGWIYVLRSTIVATLTNNIKEFTTFCTFTTLFLVDYFTGSYNFNINNVITALTLITLMELPLLMIGQKFAQVLSALTSFQRIQAFLGKRERPRAFFSSVYSPQQYPNIHSTDILPENVEDTHSQGITKEDFDLRSMASIDESNLAASFDCASLGWSPNGKAVLTNVSFQIPVSKMTVICGPIGSGKTTLIQSLLGEVDVLKGRVRLPLLEESVAYVAQDGWLQENATIRDNITLQMPFQAELYQTVIYATALHIDLLQLENHDDTLAKSLSGGQRQRLAVARALYTQAEAYLMDDFTSALDSITASHVWNALMGPTGLLRNKTVVIITNSLRFLQEASMVIRLQAGKVVEVGRPQMMSEEGIETISRASIDETERSNALAKKEAFKILESMDRKDVKQEDVEQGKIQLSVYKKYILAAGIYASIFVFIFGIALQNGLVTSWNLYLQYFARARNEFFVLHTEWAWLSGFICLIFLSMAVPAFFDLLAYAICFLRVGKRLHADEVKGVWNAGLEFFQSNPPGVIINRFSQDLFHLDWELTINLSNLLNTFWILVIQFLLLVIPVPLLIAVVVVIILMCLGLQRLYAPSSRQLRRLEMATKSPLYSLIWETSQASGLATIRASRRQKMFIDNNVGRLDRSQQPFFFLQAVRRWLFTWLNLLAMVVNVALVMLVVLLKNTNSVVVLGAGLINATKIAFNLNVALVAYTEVEITSIAVERITAFASLEPEEKPLPNGMMRKELIPGNVKGKIEIRNLTVTYPESKKSALRNLNLLAIPGERIGVCGRSGSGKSTLLLALFRMLEPTQGEILLDDESVQNYTAISLRNSFTVVPQDALVLSMTIRDNLDPLEEQDDLAIWDALETCHLAEVIREFPDGLNAKLNANFNLSAGQRQLFNLTRALLRKRKVLVLDEATSSMDYETDAKIQQLLQTQFKFCTILTVAHRISTIRDYDRVLVLDDGEMIELDSPDNLMRNPSSVFHSLAMEQNVQ